MRELTETEIQEVNGGWIVLAVRGVLLIGSLISMRKAY